MAVLAGGTAMYVTGTAAADDANRMPRATSAEDASYRSAYRSATSRWQAGTALIGVGVLGAAVAVWLHVQVPASTQTTLAPLFTSQSVGLAWAVVRAASPRFAQGVDHIAQGDWIDRQIGGVLPAAHGAASSNSQVDR